MSSHTQPANMPPVRACTVSHGIEDFDLLIEDLERTLPGQWGDLRFDEVVPFLTQPDAADLELFIIALDEDDSGRLGEVSELIAALRPREIPIAVVADGLGPAELKTVLRHGGDEYLAYPPDAGAVAEVIARLRATPHQPAPEENAATAATADKPVIFPKTAPKDSPAEPAPEPARSLLRDAAPDTPKKGLLSRLSRPFSRGADPLPEPQPETPSPPRPAKAESPGPKAARRKSGPARIIAVQGLIGGAGASTLAVNLAHELAQAEKKHPRAVCLMDFDFQFGTVALQRDLSEKGAVVDLLSDTESMDDDAFRLALHRGDDGVDVLTAPEDLIPMDFVNGDDIGRLIDTAARGFDVVVIDMPRSIQDWTETVISRADQFLTVIQVDVASAQNVLRLRRALQAENISLDGLRFVLNRAPRRTDLTARSRMQSMAQSLDIRFDLILPSDPAAASASADQGEPLARCAPRSALRKAIATFAHEAAPQHSS